MFTSDLRYRAYSFVFFKVDCVSINMRKTPLDQQLQLGDPLVKPKHGRCYLTIWSTADDQLLKFIFAKQLVADCIDGDN